MKKPTYLIPFLILLLLSCQKQSQKNITPVRPNIVFILADDLGYGDLSCYGQQHFQTPNLDKMAAGGMRFTQHYSGTTVCAPSRCSLMTGKHTGHTAIRGNKEWQPEGQFPMAAGEITVAELLKQAGYVTGAFGKWGLGFVGTEGDPNQQGFDEFYGYNCQRMAHNYYPGHLWDDSVKVEIPENSGDKFGVYAPELIHQRALQFIEKNKDKPFFLFYPNIIPHAELLLPEENLAEYRGKFLPENAFKGTEPGDQYFRIGGYGTQPEGHAAFAAMVTLLDKQVGEILAKLKELGLEKNTLVVFSSDNGPHQEGGADPDYFDSNGRLKGYKRDLYEGGIRVPMIAFWEGKIVAGSTSDHVSAFWDFLPTVAEVAGVKAPENTDGISYLPALLGKEQKQHEYLYWEFHESEGRQAVRKGDWKLIYYYEDNRTELFNLADDPGETTDVSEKFPEKTGELQKILNRKLTDTNALLPNSNSTK